MADIDAPQDFDGAAFVAWADHQSAWSACRPWTGDQVLSPQFFPDGPVRSG